MKTKKHLMYKVLFNDFLIINNITLKRKDKILFTLHRKPLI